MTNERSNSTIAGGIGGATEAGLNEIIVTPLLHQRPPRPADHAAENRALLGLAQVMGDAPLEVLQKLAETVLELTGADSAGISLLENDGEKSIFRWRATAGAFFPLAQSTLPRDFSPCGVVLDRDAPQLMSEPARFYPYMADLRPHVFEALLVPFHRGERPIGTIWVVAHSKERRFDAEDARLVSSLAKFASAAVQAVSNVEAADAAGRTVAAEVARRSRVERSRQALSSAVERQARIFDTVLSSIADFAYSFDREGRFTYINKALLDLWGLRLEQAVGQNFFELKYPDDLAAKLQRQIQEVIDTRRTLSDETPYTSPTGKSGYYEYIFTPVFGADGEVELVAGSTRDITARKEVERELAEARRRRDSALIAGEVGTFEWDVVAERIWGDQNFVRMFSIPTDDTGTAPPAHYLAAIHPDDRERVAEQVARTVQTGGDYEVEYRITSGGQTRWVVARGKGERDSTGRVVRFPGVILDVTQRHKAEEALRESEARLADQKEAFELAINGAPIHEVLNVLVRAGQRRFGPDARTAIFIVDRDSVCLRFGAAAGLPETYTSATDRFEISPNSPSCGSAAYTGQAVIVKDVASDPLWSPYIQLAQEHGIRACWSFPIRSSGGKVIGTFAVYHGVPREPDTRDLERAMLLAQTAALIIERHKTEDALRESEARLSAILDNASAMVYVVDAQNRFRFINRRWEAVFGLTNAETAGRSLYDFFPKEIADQFASNNRTVLQSRTPDESEEVVPHASGDHTYLSVKVPLFGRDGEPYAICGISTDITDRKRAERERERLLVAEQSARSEAERANQAKDRFLAVLSHELRTPLTPVAMAASAMETDPRLPLEFRDDVAMIRRNVDLETRLIDDLLDLSRVTSGKLRLNPEPTRVHRAIRHVLETVGPELNDKQLKVEQELAAENDLVHADPARLQQTLWNLLKNAGKFTPAGGRIIIRTSNDHGRLVIEVADTGRGIAPEMLSRIFEPFEQGEAEVTRRYGGMGLGLAIAKAVVDRHGGTLSASSAGVGKGASFSVSLPLGQIDSPLAPAIGNGATDSNNRLLRVLLVEDDADSAKLLVRLLRLDGTEVQWAGTVAAAVQCAASEPFDVVVSDLDLPDGSGHDLIRRLLRDRPVVGIAVSGYGMEDDIRQSREAGFVEHLVKPVTLPQLREAIRRVAGTK